MTIFCSALASGQAQRQVVYIGPVGQIQEEIIFLSLDQSNIARGHSDLFVFDGDCPLVFRKGGKGLHDLRHAAAFQGVLEFVDGADIVELDETAFSVVLVHICRFPDELLGQTFAAVVLEVHFVDHVARVVGGGHEIADFSLLIIFKVPDDAVVGVVGTDQLAVLPGVGALLGHAVAGLDL